LRYSLRRADGIAGAAGGSGCEPNKSADKTKSDVAESIYTPEQHGPRIRAFLTSLIEKAGFELEFEVAAGENPHPEIEDPELVVRFSGPDVELLLANKAELLLALEYLTMEMMHMPHDHHERMCFDANDYRMLRIAELRLSATTAAERVKRSKTPFRFSPMSSRERRIIHLALRNEPEVRSESSGAGPFRQVVIYPAGMPAPPEPPREAGGYRPGGPPRRGPGGGGFGGGGGERGGGERGGVDRRGPRRGPGGGR
jgi:spoIIIJ-associated protein